CWLMPYLAPMSVSVSVVCSTKSCCRLNIIMVTSKNFGASSLAMQRANIDAAAALMSSGNSREMKRTLPVSIYFDCSIGNTFSANAAQCGQVREEYSTTVIGAVADPSTMSGKRTGFAISAALSSSALVDSVGGGADKALDAKSAVRTVAARAARRAKRNGLFLRCRHPRAHSRAAGCRTKRLEPDGVQVHAVGHQAKRHRKTEAGQHRDRLERAIGRDRSNQFHG